MLIAFFRFLNERVYSLPVVVEPINFGIQSGFCPPNWEFELCSTRCSGRIVAEEKLVEAIGVVFCLVVTTSEK